MGFLVALVAWGLPVLILYSILQNLRTIREVQNGAWNEITRLANIVADLRREVERRR